MLKFTKNLFSRLQSQKLSLAVIYVEYDRNDNGASGQNFSTLQRYLAPIIETDITFLRVDNKNELSPINQISPYSYTIGGDNTFREFSGWQKGFSTLAQNRKGYDLVLFVNDMFLAPGESFLKDYGTKDLLKKSLTENSIIGRIDSTGQSYTVYGYDVSRWVCTNCFLAPWKAIETLSDIVSIKNNLDDFLPTSLPQIVGPVAQNTTLALQIFKNTAPINDQYKIWLVEWLTERWHSRFDIEETTWDLFRTKVRNILNESLLTARLREIGVAALVYGNKHYY